MSGRRQVTSFPRLASCAGAAALGAMVLVGALLAGCASAPSSGAGPVDTLIRVEGAAPGADLSSYEAAEVVDRGDTFDLLHEYLRTRPLGYGARLELEVEVLASGRAGRVQVAEGVDPELDRRVAAIVRKWGYSPTLDPAGQPVTSWIRVTIVLRKTA